MYVKYFVYPINILYRAIICFYYTHIQYRKTQVVRTLNQQEMPSEQRETSNEKVLTFYR